MARTMKYLERKAMEAYAEFLESFNCQECPMGNPLFELPTWVKELRKKTLRGNYWGCDVCDHFFGKRDYSDNPCPCCRIGPEKALAMLRRYVKKWRKEGLIK